MSHSSCPCCSNPEVLSSAQEFFANHGIQLKHCPVCKQPVETIDIMKWVRDRFNITTRDLIKDENGKSMILERTPWSEKPETKRMSYEVDLDKIDISRELELLEKHKDKENARKADLLAARIVQFWQEKYGDQED